MEGATEHFYQNWTFWSFIVAGIAVALSQMRPIRLWRPIYKLNLEVFSHIFLNHWVGNVNAQLHILLTNNGNRPIRINEISVEFLRTDVNPHQRFTLPGKNYLQLPSDKTSIILTSFLINPGEDWGHVINFLNYFSRQDDLSYKELRGQLRSEIDRLLAARPEGSKGAVAVDQQFYTPAINFFNTHFQWFAGDYQASLNIKTNIKSADITKRYQFTIFESDENELRRHTNDYKYGAGVYFNNDTHTGLLIQLREVPINAD